MTLSMEKLLAVEHSKKQCDRIVQYIGSNKDHLEKKDCTLPLFVTLSASYRMWRYPENTMVV
ncbi:MAG: hypothetical protein BGO55_00145 [Sphingobacteriales bacterium 50-39]|nr:hypothetical protein [Sphingobacteriales bacterium]OJW53534.1 MAG: hypothetical protein BGO55_00145 [Sphingobacteriales bacterium 50-39]